MGWQDKLEVRQGLTGEEIEEIAASLESHSDGDGSEASSGGSEASFGGCYLLALLGPFLAGPAMDDGWFAADFAMAHKIYGNLEWEQKWMTAVDLHAEVQSGGSYLWGSPKHRRLEVFNDNDDIFYDVSDANSLVSDFKDALCHIVSDLGEEGKLLLLIFAHGDDATDEEDIHTGILVGKGDNEGFGTLHTFELNDMLKDCKGQVTLITSACYGGTWHNPSSRTTYSAANDTEEALSLNMSNSGCFRGGFFWEAMWYELSRLGIREAGMDVDVNHSFKKGVERVRDRIMSTCTLGHPIPVATVAYEDQWDHHFRKVINLDDDRDQSDLQFVTVAGNEWDANEEPMVRAGGSRYHNIISRLSRLHDIYTGGWIHEPTWGSQGSGTSSSQASGSRSSQSSGGGGAQSLIDFYTYMRNATIPLVELVKYFTSSMPGLNNLPSNMGAHGLVRKYHRGLATPQELENLSLILKYRLVQDVKAQAILNYLNIPRVCHIFKFRAETYCNREKRQPYLNVVDGTRVFDKPPLITPPCYKYRKPKEYLASAACAAKLDLNWWRDALHEYEASMEFATMPRYSYDRSSALAPTVDAH